METKTATAVVVKAGSQAGFRIAHMPKQETMLQSVCALQCHTRVVGMDSRSIVSDAGSFRVGFVIVSSAGIRRTGRFCVFGARFL